MRLPSGALTGAAQSANLEQFRADGLECERRQLSPLESDRLSIHFPSLADLRPTGLRLLCNVDGTPDALSWSKKRQLRPIVGVIGDAEDREVPNEKRQL